MKNIEIQNEISGIKNLLLKNDFFQDEMMDFQSACKYLNLSTSFVYKLTHAKKIPCYKPGGKKIYFSKSDLIAYMKSNRMSSKDEIENKVKKYFDDKRKNQL